MAKSKQKPKTGGATNDARSNKKANKKGAMRHRGTTLTDIQKVLLGGGVLVNIAKNIKQ